jgi:hypothetical protein
MEKGDRGPSFSKPRPWNTGTQPVAEENLLDDARYAI